MIDFILNFIICITYSLFLYNLLKEMLILKEPTWVKPLLFLIVLCSSDAIILPAEITGCIVLAVFLLITLIFCSKNYVHNLSCVLVFYPIIVSINYLTQDIGLLIWKYIFQKNMTPIAETILSNGALALRIPIWYLIYRFTRPWIADISQNLTSKMWLIIDAVCTTSFIGIITMVYYSDSDSSYITYPACIACIVTGLGTCYLCSYLSHSIKTALEVQTLKYQQSYYEELENNQLKVRKLRHDMKNHLNVIHTFLTNQEPKQASEYLTTLSDEFSTEQHVFCHNSIINAILNTKYLQAKEHHIQCFFQVDIGNDIGIDSISLCSLIANTLDNALEASMQIPEIAKRNITVKARCFNGFFSYEIKNTMNQTIIKKNGMIQTSKKDSDAHGFGLQNMKDMVSRYHGTIEIAYTDAEFTITTLIPLK